MVKCDRCGTQHRQLELIVTETRPKTYVNVVAGHRIETHGNEIAKEERLCGECKPT